MRREASGRFELPLPAAEAFWLFTPEGERGWVPGWEPSYPGGEPSEAPGTVFITQTQGVETVWVILALDRSRASAVYARVTPGAHAGTVAVNCEDASTGRCVVAVRYDLTAIGNADQSVLEPYTPERFEDMMGTWAAAIGGYLAE